MVLSTLALLCTGTLLHWYYFAAGIVILHSSGNDVSEKSNFSIFSAELSRVSYSLLLLCNVDKVTNKYFGFLESTKSRNILYPLTLS